MEIYKLFDNSMPPRVSEFLNYLITVKNMSFKTIKNYKSDIYILLKFIKKAKLSIKENIELIDISDLDDKFIKNITLTDLYMYLTYLTVERKNGASARARKIASTKAFFNYLEKKIHLLEKNPARELETPKREKKNPIYLDLNESTKLLKCIKGRNKVRDKAIITIFLNCGLRLSELINIDVTSIKGDVLTVTGKGNKQRSIYLNDACLKSIKKYMLQRPKVISDEKALFLSERKIRISESGVQNIVKQALLSAGLTEKKYTTHKLRHTAATLLYKHGNVDIKVLQEILGHESIATTQIYTHTDNEQLRKASALNPLANL